MNIQSDTTTTIINLNITIPSLFIVEDNSITNTIKINSGYIYYNGSISKQLVAINNNKLDTVTIIS